MKFEKMITMDVMNFMIEEYCLYNDYIKAKKLNRDNEVKILTQLINNVIKNRLPEYDKTIEQIYDNPRYRNKKALDVFEPKIVEKLIIELKTLFLKSCENEDNISLKDVNTCLDNFFMFVIDCDKNINYETKYNLVRCGDAFFAEFEEIN